jgi:molybdopterin-guanine dinucleotide biosynthesis protein MobB
MKIFGITGKKNSGKTTLMERLVAEMNARGYSVSTIKHTHHSVDIDQAGKDSHRHRVAGAQQVLLSCHSRWAVMTEIRNRPEPSLDELVAQLTPVDLLLVEGYKRDAHAKIEAHRHETGQALIAEDDPTIKAVASNTSALDIDHPILDLNNTTQIAEFILEEVGYADAELQRTGSGGR